MNNLVPLITFSEFSKLKEILKFLKVQLVGLELPILQLNGISNQLDIEVFSRLTIVETEKFNSKLLKQKLGKNRFKYEWIVVEPKSADVSALSARDRRVDAIRISHQSKLKIFNTRYGRRLHENNKIVEIDLSFLWEKSIAVKLRPILRILQAFKSCNLNYILTNLPTDPYQLRSYRGMQSLGRLFGITNSQSNPVSFIDRLERNRKKQLGIIPVEGVEVIEW